MCTGYAALCCVNDSQQSPLERLCLHTASVILRLKSSSLVQYRQLLKSADNATLQMVKSHSALHTFISVLSYFVHDAFMQTSFVDGP